MATQPNLHLAPDLTSLMSPSPTPTMEALDKEDPLGYNLGLESSYQPRSLFAMKIQNKEQEKEIEGLKNTLKEVAKTMVTLGNTISGQMTVLPRSPYTPIITPNRVNLTTSVERGASPARGLEDQEDIQMAEPSPPGNSRNNQYSRKTSTL